MKPRPIPERAVQSQIVQLLRSLGASVYVLGTRRPRGDYQGTAQTPGIGDLFVILPEPKLADGSATGVWIECKATGGRLRPEQAEFQQHCRAARIPHIVGGVEEVLEFLVTGGWISAANLPHYRAPAVDSSASSGGSV
jgi:hypothetical protein